MDPESGDRGQGRALRLVGIDKAAPRELLLAEGRTQIGSADENDLVIADSTVSRRHAEIWRRLARYRVKDLGSTNGTFLNGRKLTAGAALNSGDELRIGKVRFVVLDTAATRASRRRLRMRTVIEILAALFIVGFIGTEYFLRTGAPLFHPGEGAVSAPIHADTDRVALHPPATAESAAGKSSAEAESGGPQPPWLVRLNHYRAAVNLPPASGDEALSAGDAAHARYLVENYGEALARGGQMHTEKSGAPGYSAAGLQAASASDVMQWAGHGTVGFSADDAIDGWIAIPFHRLPILSPRLKRVGYGQYCSDDNCAAALNVQTGAEQARPIPNLFADPIQFPPGGSTTAFRSGGNEWPDPLSSCPGYSVPTGLPITLQLGSRYKPVMSAFSIKRDGADVTACGFDATSYTNSDAAVEQLGRDILRLYGAVVVIPREPFVAGSTYSVSITADGKPYAWSFKVD
ncbi:MAG TPA: FHA domain-containing protein [Candidatus Binataceae bacterium]|nr:FHA domain-containing protein [Candidatus Binataceae bacterium]